MSELPDIDTNKIRRKAIDDIKNSGPIITANFYNFFKDITSPKHLKVYLWITIVFVILTGIIFYPLKHVNISWKYDSLIKEWLKQTFLFFINLASYFWTIIVSMLFQKFINNAGNIENQH